MKKNIGLWIDHRETIIVTLTNGEEEIKHVESGSAHLKTHEGAKEITAEDQQDRKFTNQLNRYYDEVIMLIRDADRIKIFGPGEAKNELEKRIFHEGFAANMLPTETADKMTDPQIAAKVRETFLN